MARRRRRGNNERVILMRGGYVPFFMGTYPVNSGNVSPTPASAPAFPGAGGINAPGVAGGPNSGMGPTGMAEADDEVADGSVSVTKDGENSVQGFLLGEGRVRVYATEQAFATDDHVTIEGSAYEIDSAVALVDGSQILFLLPSEE